MAEARSSIVEALELNRETASRRGRAYCLSSLGDVEMAAGDLDVARVRYEAALEIRKSLNERTNVAYSLLSLAQLAVEQGRPGAGADADAEGFAQALAAKARLDEGESAEAETMVAPATDLLAKSESRDERLAVTIWAAEIAAARGRTGDALRMLRETIDEARSLGFVDLALKSGLALGVVERRSGRPDGAERLQAVAEEAAERGFVLIADKARIAARAPKTTASASPGP